MVEKSTIISLRNGIDDVCREVFREMGGGVASNTIILDRVKTKRHDEIRDLNGELVEMSLVKLINDVSRRQTMNLGASDGPDLFGHYRGIPQRVAIGREKKKHTAKLTINEAKLWLKAHSPKVKQDRYSEFRRLVEDCERYGAAGDETLEEAMKRMRMTEELDL